MAKSLIDYISDEDYPRYEEILNMAQEAKAKAPKAPRKPRGPMTKEQKIKASEKRLAAAQAKLDALLAGDAE